MSSNDRAKQLKKRLFVLAGYLVVTAVLLVYLSFSSYRIKIESTVTLPKAYTINASLEIDEESDEHAAKALSTSVAAVTLDSNYNALVGLAPGKSAATYATTSTEEIAQQRRFIVNVNNTNEGITPCALDLTYTLEVETTGRLPLTFAIKDSATDTVITASAIVDCTSDESSTSAAFVKGDNPNSSSAQVMKFTLKGGQISSNTHVIYVGWNDASERADDIDLCKEVDKITIKAHIYAEKPTYSTSENVDELEIVVTEQEPINIE